MDCTHASLRPTPDQDASFAAEALFAGDLAHAAYHVGCALGSDVTRPEWLDLLRRIKQDAGPDPLRIVPLQGRVSFATVGVRAWMLHEQGQPAQALELLSQVVHAKRDTDFVRWGLPWMEAQGVAEQAPIEPTLSLLSVILTRLAPSDPSVPTRVLQVLERLSTRHRTHSGVVWLRGTLLHRLGRLDEALAVATEAHATIPNWVTATLLAIVHRARGDVTPALEAYQAALGHDATQNATRLDIADMLHEQGRFDEALTWYQAALSHEPGRSWALASVAALQYRANGERDALEHLLSVADTTPGPSRESQLAASVTRELVPWVDYLPLRIDAGIHALRQMSLQPPAATGNTPPRVKLTTQWLEAPSVQLAWELHREWRGFPCIVDVVVQEVQRPDPRQPVEPVELTLWSYTDTRPTRAVPPPPDEVGAALAELASAPFQLEGWWREAERTARALSAHEPEAFARAMVHPPPPRGSHSTWAWLQRIQLAAAFVIAAREEGWLDSRRRTLLLALAKGPMDWTVEAALMTLAHVARTTPEARTEVRALFQSLDQHTQDYASYEYALVCAWLQLPEISDTERTTLEARRKNIESLAGP
ncbi:tetratricopeptide repeat protein [Myxococcus sp. K38C18041901]|uniref:tetratricopeptide repeat protein n=1 Tax=Myxococcus guangdongensis TaxID=2906760 RepID=UPI0020A7416C|nr:tetratricopeptide repeat protein [Myxococcus guangdongensis]MCP3065184.1 tetratricopeptide repeat protein [Myxococcus guangdongensis]